VVEGVPLLRGYTSKGYRGFESHPLRHPFSLPLNLFRVWLQPSPTRGLWHTTWHTKWYTFNMKRVDRHLYVRNGWYLFRRRVPIAFTHAFGGKGTIKESLHTDSIEEARRRLHVCEMRFDAVLAAATTPWEPTLLAAVVPTPKGQPFSEAAVHRAVRAWLQHYLSTFNRQTHLGYGPAYKDDELASNAILEHLKEEVDQTADVDWDLPDARRHIPLRMTHLTNHIIKECGFDLIIDSKEYLTVSAVAFAGLREAIAQQTHAKKTNQYIAQNDRLFSAKRYAEDLQPVATHTVADARDGYLHDAARSKVAKTRGLYVARLGVIVEALGADTPIANVDRAACRRIVRDILPHYPAHPTELMKRLPLEKRMDRARRKVLATLSPTTQNLYIDAMSGMLNWARHEGLIVSNPAENLRVRKSKAKMRLPFNTAELKAIFSASIYTGCADDEGGYNTPGPNRPQRHRFWVPLIALYSGMRLNEICQLDRGDVVERGGNWMFVLWAGADERETVGSGAGVEATRTLKNRASERPVPVHPALIEFGLLDYLQSLPPGKGRVFPSLTGNPKGSGADPLSKWFSRFLKDIDVKTPKLSFHSFRHSFRDALRNCGVPLDVQQAIGGWTDESVSGKYGLGHSDAVLAEAMSKVKYPDLDLSHLLPTGDREASGER
jgi:integrase